MTLLAVTGCFSPNGDAVHLGEPAWLAEAELDLVILEVDYLQPAAPAVAPLRNGLLPWEVVRANVNRLLMGRVPRVRIPTRLEEMGLIPASATRLRYGSREIEELSAQTRDPPDARNASVFHVLFLDGVYRDSSGQSQPDVFGVHLSGKPIFAIFPSMIRAAGHQGDAAALLEQVTLVHELGHAVGLVDEGIAMQTPHHDDEYPSHCTHPRCVMRPLPSLPSALFAPIVDETSLVLFGPACLQDIDAL